MSPPAVVTFAALVERIMARPGAVRLVAVDGPGGAGKSTFAARLAAHAGGAPVVHTDDVASADHPIDWWPRLLRDVIEPIAAGGVGRFRRYDWDTQRLAEWLTVPRAPLVVIEGVTAGRREWRDHLAFIVWIETPHAGRLRRGLERDGDEMDGQWADWMAAEDEHYARDPTIGVADVVVDGQPSIDHDPERSFVVMGFPGR